MSAEERPRRVEGRGERILRCLTRIVDELYPSGKINLFEYGTIIIHSINHSGGISPQIACYLTVVLLNKLK